MRAHASWCQMPVVLTALSAAAWAPGAAHAQIILGNVTAIARAPGGLGAMAVNVKSTAGAGGVASVAWIGGGQDGAGATKDPAMGGSPFSNLANIGTKANPVMALSAAQTRKIGLGLEQAYINVPTGGKGLKAGQNLSWNVDSDSDKVAATLANGGKLTLNSKAGPLTMFATTTSATAAQDLVSKNGKTVSAMGTPTATIDKELVNPLNGQKNPNPPAFAAAAIHDPITFGVDSAGSPGSVDVTVGNDQAPLFLQVTDPGGYADAFYELDVNGVELLSFDWAVTFNTSSENQALNVDFISSTLGTEAAFRTFMEQNVTFDDHTLSASSVLQIATIPVTLQTGPQTITYDYGGVVASSVPEPSGAAAAGALAVAAFGLRLRRRFGVAGCRT